MISDSRTVHVFCINSEFIVSFLAKKNHKLEFSHIFYVDVEIFPRERKFNLVKNTNLKIWIKTKIIIQRLL